LDKPVNDIPHLVRQPAELKAARQLLGMSAEQLAQMLRVDGGGRTVRRWEAGEREIPGPVIVVLETAMSYLTQKDAIMRQLDLLQSGKMRSHGVNWLPATEVDTTDANIVQLMEHKSMFDEALKILTRQPPGEGGDGTQPVHWYRLIRMSPKHAPPEEDDWTIPGETSPEAALASFVRLYQFGHGLELCGDGDMRAEFLLQQRHAVRSQHGASYRIREGELVKEFYVRPT
jgi:transcriptional regulator with XRE-family HTH domain